MPTATEIRSYPNCCVHLSALTLTPPHQDSANRKMLTGDFVGDFDGPMVGVSLGDFVGDFDGPIVGVSLGDLVGPVVFVEGCADTYISYEENIAL